MKTLKVVYEDNTGARHMLSASGEDCYKLLEQISTDGYKIISEEWGEINLYE